MTTEGSSGSVRASSRPPLRIGILGTAHIARQFVRDVAPSPALRIVAVASRSPQAAAAFAAEHRIERHHGRYEDLLDDPQVDAVYLPLPNSLHAAWAVKAARAGKHVLCEKPLALGLAEAQAMFAAARRHGVMLLVVDLRPPGPVGVEGLVANHRILLVADKLERAGADRFAVDHLGRAGGLHLVGVFGTQDRGEVDRQVGHERRLGFLQHEAHRRRIDLLEPVDDILHVHIVEVGEGLARRRLVERVRQVGHAVVREQHVVGIEVARRRELRMAWNLTPRRSLKV